MRSCFVLLLLLPVTLPAQAPAGIDTGRVVAALLSTDPGPGLCIDDSALGLSGRLGISYSGVTRKYLISYDLDDSVKARLRNGGLVHSTTVTPLGDGYDRLTLKVPALGLSSDFYFRDGCLTSPFFPLTKGWRSISSRYFSIVASDSSLTNSHAVAELDDFVDRVGSLLRFTEADYSVLKTGKILYYLCANEDEIQRLTGYKTRGMYNLAYDAIVSTYNSHFHELTHLLVNFKLRHLDLYSHPFLQEGIAVALGGRGGLGPDVVTELGTFLDESEALRYPGLLRRSEFNSLDASMSYPVAGAYNRFLLEAIGAENYLDLYRRHGGSPGDSSLETIPESELPSPGDWELALRRFGDERTVQFQKPAGGDKPLWRSDRSAIHEQPDRYLFTIREALLFGPCDSSRTLRSERFSELFPDTDYPGHRYAALADSQSVTVYDLWTNTLIASFHTSFDLSSRMVPRDRGDCLFSVPRSLFHGSAIGNECPPVDSLSRE